MFPGKIGQVCLKEAEWVNWYSVNPFFYQGEIKLGNTQTCSPLGVWGRSLGEKAIRTVIWKTPPADDPTEGRDSPRLLFGNNHFLA